jgi:DNA (cytosine-5)-methyltransferase 1
MDQDTRIPVIDLFAGPGGLGEGFASLCDGSGEPVFRIALSIEMDAAAHRTLELRAFFRRLKTATAHCDYFRYVYQQRPTVASRKALFDAHPEARDAAAAEAWCHRLTDETRGLTTARASSAVGGVPIWVLVGGPPCQAYSLVGRSRRAGDETFGSDEKHTLYLHYLHLIEDLQPPVFVMENVKGMLSANLSDGNTFSKVKLDLETAGVGYSVVPFVALTDETQPYAPGDYVIRAEAHGVPQARHRVILLGIREGLGVVFDKLHPREERVSVASVLSGLPRLRSRLSGRGGTPRDSEQEWEVVLRSAADKMRPRLPDVAAYAAEAVADGWRHMDEAVASGSASPAAEELAVWYTGVGGGTTPLNHEARSHRADDLERYLFCASFAQVRGRSPKLPDFPESLSPRHANVADGKFVDRFRVQLAGQPASTVTSHISKDGHYYIHYDASQCRALTVREAARLQTFPDDYFFEGTRTQQYHQVGNAVPPFLARQLADVVARGLGRQ